MKPAPGCGCRWGPETPKVLRSPGQLLGPGDVVRGSRSLQPFRQERVPRKPARPNVITAALGHQDVLCS